MKNFFIVAVALSALCSSCETADESFLTETINKTMHAHKTNSATHTDYETYKSIVNNFVYDKDQTYTKNVERFEQHVNRSITHDEKEEVVYEAIDSERLAELKHADVNFVEQLHYSPEFKKAFYNLLSKEPIGETILVKEEIHLLKTLLIMQNENGGNGKDDELRGGRTIAFAYGAQYSFKQAVLYAGAIELMGKEY